MALFITRQAIYALSARIKDASISTRDLITFRDMCEFATSIRAMMIPSLNMCYLKGLRAGLEAGNTEPLLNGLRPVLLSTISRLQYTDSRNTLCVGISSQNLALALVTCKCNEEAPCGVPVCRTVRDK